MRAQQSPIEDSLKVMQTRDVFGSEAPKPCTHSMAYLELHKEVDHHDMLSSLTEPLLQSCHRAVARTTSVLAGTPGALPVSPIRSPKVGLKNMVVMY